MTIKKLTFRCRVLTPIFLAGADGAKGDAVPELRAPSLKGAMRFWWRAVQAESDLARLKKTEAGIFGGVGEEEGKSIFRIRMSGRALLQTANYQLLPHHSGGGDCFCAAKQGGRCKKGMKRSAISPGQEFFVKFFYDRPLVAFPPERLRALFTLTSILGGLGKRSRRGFGSFEISGVDDRGVGRETSLEYIMELLNILAPGKYRIDNNSIVLNDAFNGQYPFIREIAIGRQCGSAKELLKTIGRASHNHDEDYLGFAGPKGRLASPVYVTVISGRGRFRPVITTLNTASERPLCGNIAVQQAFKVAVL
ncbi:type III-B CRISPR module RAMP protein Cmr1 [Desulfoscipio geothermicus]|uniref:CRISPR-associated protein Cmr1 n=1 Tax=Desulfoscipio geothermicus DSM 3669 TaxID=1121426 RepID=A0A1I6EED4_9FIRM|nr:type III-B CRISPR module RAMP protein Cmr1 [Desulfoscipio geothermicus]SFR15872.1 CRISPR-associated protein Cmr1 [Desulfoscipio geothermicus DSM 3669]